LGPEGLDVPEALRRALANRWRWNGQTEHASVAAFAQLSLDLLALGAPPALVHAAGRDGQDEIRHAELCFSLARGLGGDARGPLAFPQAREMPARPPTRTLWLAQLAVRSLIDGALHEGLSARVIAQLARRCEDPAIHAVLRELAADEGRHAAHAWEVVDWCLQEAGEPVLQALRGAAAVLPDAYAGNLPEGAADGSWERYGIPGAQLEAEEHAKARAEILRRVAGLTQARRAA
jgi:hypothetical protein